MYDIIIIGGGPAGISAAITAAKSGAEVIIIENNPMLGKKILSTGNGRCNLTNLQMDPTCYRGDDDAWIRKALEDYPPETVLDFLKGIGILTKSREGYVYPMSDQAASVRKALENTVLRLPIKVMTNSHVNGIRRRSDGSITVLAASADSDTAKEKVSLVNAKRVLLSCGSKASSIAGSDGSGYDLARMAGHTLSPVVPALTGLVASGTQFKKWSGVRTKAMITLLINGKKTARDLGEVQLTDYGISGICVFQVSRYAAKALPDGKRVEALIDFLPACSEDELFDEIIHRKNCWAHTEAQELLNTIFPEKLISVLLGYTGINRTVWAEKVSDDTWRKFSKICKVFPLSIKGTGSFEKAQVCAGGVKTSEVDPVTMESKIMPGLYLAGEILDVDGICGGYNLHFAFASGIAAGRSMAESIMVKYNPGLLGAKGVVE